MYLITKVNKRFSCGAKVTSEKFVKATDNLDEILLIAEKQGADVDEVKMELEEYGITSFKGYMIEERLGKVIL